MNNKRKFKVRKKGKVSEEDVIKRRGVLFGILTIILIIVIVIWGFPLFVNLVDYLGDLKSSTNQQVAEDTVPPPPPRFTFVPEATNSAQLTIEGVTEPKAKVYLSFNDREIETVVDEEGNFELQKLDLKEEKNTFYAFAEDEAGNKSDATEKIEIIYDTQPPELEITKPEENSLSDDQVVEIEGVTEPTARVLVNENIVIVDQEGKFLYRMTLQEGSNDIVIKSEDKAGNVTEETRKVTYLP